MRIVWRDDWDPDRMMNGSTHGWMYGGWWLMVLLTVLLVAVVVATLVYALRIASPSDPVRPPATGSPRDVLDQRLARGEITPEEYRATRALLGP